MVFQVHCSGLFLQSRIIVLRIAFQLSTDFCLNATLRPSVEKVRKYLASGARPSAAAWRRRNLRWVFGPYSPFPVAAFRVMGTGTAKRQCVWRFGCFLWRRPLLTRFEKWMLLERCVHGKSFRFMNSWHERKWPGATSVALPR